jgi:L-ribulose-5-phosphate 3-epimerase UlaE
MFIFGNLDEKIREKSHKILKMAITIADRGG